MLLEFPDVGEEDVEEDLDAGSLAPLHASILPVLPWRAAVAANRASVHAFTVRLGRQ